MVGEGDLAAEGRTPLHFITKSHITLLCISRSCRRKSWTAQRFHTKGGATLLSLAHIWFIYKAFATAFMGEQWRCQASRWTCSADCRQRYLTATCYYNHYEINQYLLWSSGCLCANFWSCSHDICDLEPFKTCIWWKYTTVCWLSSMLWSYACAILSTCSAILVTILRAKLCVFDVRVNYRMLQEQLVCEQQQKDKALARCEELESHLAEVSLNL